MHPLSNFVVVQNYGALFITGVSVAQELLNLLNLSFWQEKSSPSPRTLNFSVAE